MAQSTGGEVSALVGALQSGEISKTELFAKLSALRQQPARRGAAPGGGDDVQRLVGAMRAGELTKADLAKSLAEAAGRARGAAAPRVDIPTTATSAAPPTDESMARELREADMWAELRRESTKQSLAVDVDLDDPGAPPEADAEADAPPSSARRVPAEEAPPRKVAPHAVKPYMEPTHTVRLAAADDDCTFRPKIKEMPRALYPEAKTTPKDRGAFLARTERWAEQRDAQLARRREGRAEAELDDCTFAPQISTNSRRSAAVTRPHASVVAPGRLYEDERRRREERDARHEAVAAARDRDFAARHPFRPALQATNLDVRPRYRSAAKPKRDDAKPPHCTFRPSVKGVGDKMEHAQTYLACDVFERLAVSLPARPQAPAEAPAPSPPKKAIPETSERWQTFLRRQRACDAKRERKVRKLEEEAKPAFAPTVGGRTASAQRGGDGFLERLAVAARRRERRELEAAERSGRKGANPDDLECTFAPEISTKAKKTVRPRRSAAELSAGDALRKETNRRLLMLQREREERARHAFKPTLATSTTAESKLRIASDPGAYLERLRDDADRRKAALQRKRDEHDENALADATFTPKTTKCPAYITRIARGMALASNGRRAPEEKARPAWQ